MLAAAGAAALLVGLLVVTTAPSDPSAGRPTAAASLAGARVEGCGPLRAREVSGKRPAYLKRLGLTRFWGDEAVCGGMWLFGKGATFVPQGLAIRGRTAWVTGYDGRFPLGRRPCRIYRLDLPSGTVVAKQLRIEGSVGRRPPVYCRHGGGVVAEGPRRLWVAETHRLWLLDPRRVGTGKPFVRRVWRLRDGVFGSVAVLDPERGLGLGKHTSRGYGRLDWYSTDRLLRSSRVSLGPSGTHRAPRGMQGLTHGALRPGVRGGVWATLTRPGCAVLVGPLGQRVPVMPGAEGIAFDGRGGLWMLSESSTRLYHDPGDPVVPTLARYSVATLRQQVALDGARRRAEGCLRR